MEAQCFKNKKQCILPPSCPLRGIHIFPLGYLHAVICICSVFTIASNDLYIWILLFNILDHVDLED